MLDEFALGVSVLELGAMLPTPGSFGVAAEPPPPHA
jgi:hypothetical protein